MHYFTSQAWQWGLLGLVGAAAAQTGNSTTDFSTWFEVAEFPDAQAANVSRLQAEAQGVASTDLWQEYQHRCINAGQKYPEIGSAAQTAGFVAPAKPFDSLIFVGASGVSTWAIETGDGLILIDSMDNADEAKRIVIGGLEAFGYEGADVKALIITHEHYDHYGGAQWLQETYNISVYASELAWDAMAELEGTPARDKVLSDGDKVTVGNSTVEVYATPGHTPGCISLLFDVYEHGSKHLAGLYGGGGIPSSADDKATQIESFQRFAGLVQKRRANVLLANHQTQDHTLQHLDVLANRQCDGAECTLPNPYIVGTERYVRYLNLMALCVRVRAARINQFLRI